MLAAAHGDLLTVAADDPNFETGGARTHRARHVEAASDRQHERLSRESGRSDGVFVDGSDTSGSANDAAFEHARE
jgi:hypothetical protein